MFAQAEAAAAGGGQSSKGAAKKINQLLSKIELAVEHTQVVLAQRHGDRQSAACMLLKYVSVRQREGGRSSERGRAVARECAHAFCHFDLSFVLNFYLTFNAGALLS